MVSAQNRLLATDQTQTHLEELNGVLNQCVLIHHLHVTQPLAQAAWVPPEQMLQVRLNQKQSLRRRQVPLRLQKHSLTVGSHLNRASQTQIQTSRVNQQVSFFSLRIAIMLMLHWSALCCMCLCADVSVHCSNCAFQFIQQQTPVFK